MSANGKRTRSLHPETKTWILNYIERDQPALAKKMSVMYLGAYSTNPLLGATLDKDSDKYQLITPVHESVRMPIIDPTKSTGLFARALIEDEAPGVKLLACDSELTLGEVAETWARATGKETALVPVTTDDVHKRMGVPWKILDAVDYLNENEYTASVPGIIWPEQLKTKVETQSFENWLRETYVGKASGCTAQGLVYITAV